MEKSVPAATPSVTAGPGASAPGPSAVSSPAPIAPAPKSPATAAEPTRPRNPKQTKRTRPTGPIALALRLAFILAVMWLVIVVVRDGFTTEAAVGVIVAGGLGAVAILKRLEK